MSEVAKAAKVVHGDRKKDKVVVVDGLDAWLGGAKLVSCRFVVTGMRQFNGWISWVQITRQGPRRRARNALDGGRGYDGNVKAKCGVMGREGDEVVGD